MRVTSDKSGAVEFESACNRLGVQSNCVARTRDRVANRADN